MVSLFRRSFVYLVLLGGCAGNLSSDPGPPMVTTDADAPNDVGLSSDAGYETGPMTGPIDAASLPAVLTLTCDRDGQAVALRLPCAVGLDPLNATECYSEEADSQYPILNFVVPLKSLAGALNQPFDLKDFVRGPSPYGLRGTITFLQIDTVSRAFVARLDDDSAGVPVTVGDGACTGHGAMIWAVAGNFL